MKKLLGSKHFHIVFSMLCLGGAALGIFLTSDKDISPLIPLMVAFIPVLVQTFTAGKQIEHATENMEKSAKLIEENTETSNLNIAFQFSKLAEQVENLQKTNRELVDKVARLEHENSELKSAINALTRRY